MYMYNVRICDNMLLYIHVYYLQVPPLIISCDRISGETVKASMKSILPRLTQLETLNLKGTELGIEYGKFAKSSCCVMNMGTKYMYNCSSCQD